MNFLYRLQEWLADRVRWVQYPDFRKISRKPDWQPYGSSVFVEVDQNSDKARLSFFGAIGLVVFSIIVGIIGLAVIGVGCFLLWVIVSTLFQ